MEGAAFPSTVPVAGIAAISSHNTIQGLQVQRFPNGIVVVAGLLGPGTARHNTVTNNVVKESPAGIVVITGDAPGSILEYSAGERGAQYRLWRRTDHRWRRWVFQATSFFPRPTRELGTC